MLVWTFAQSVTCQTKWHNRMYFTGRNQPNFCYICQCPGSRILVCTRNNVILFIDSSAYVCMLSSVIGIFLVSFSFSCICFLDHITELGKITGWYLGIHKVKVVVYSMNFPHDENNRDILFCDSYHLYNSHSKVRNECKIRRESKDDKIDNKTELGWS